MTRRDCFRRLGLAVAALLAGPPDYGAALRAAHRRTREQITANALTNSFTTARDTTLWVRWPGGRWPDGRPIYSSISAAPAASRPGDTTIIFHDLPDA